MMKIKTFTLGLFQTNCFLLSCERSQEAVIIDPPDSDSQLTDYIKRNKLKLQYILLTHGHIDHIGGVAYVKENSNAKILIHRADLSLVENVSVYAQWFDMNPPPSFKIDDFLAENQIISFGTIKLKVLFTPGHTPGCVCFIHEANAFVGDTLFAGSIGRTDLPGGDYEMIIASIKNKLLILDESTTVFSGHGPETNIKIEKESNRFLND